MRYDNWDVILFPRDSHVPIQEFKTACYTSSQGESGRPFSTLTCYVSSLPVSFPFRVSVHSWSTEAKPSAIIESLRKGSEKVVHTVQIIVDGARVFHGYYDLTSKWPQEIVHEKRSITSLEQATSQRKRRMEFPPFHHNVLLQSFWEARDHRGRINIVLSEQLISKTSPSEVALGAVNEIVCFSFHHAPREILEQAGISWPIRNPLFCSPAASHESSSLSTSFIHPSQDSTLDARTQSPTLHHSRSIFAGSLNPEPDVRSKTGPSPHSTQFPRPPVGRRGWPRVGIWDESFEETFHDAGGSLSMDNWPMRKASSTFTDIAIPDYMYVSPRPGKHCPPRNRSATRREKGLAKNQRDQFSNKDKKEQQVLVSLRDDQLGQIIDAMSPPKSTKSDHRNLNDQHSDPEFITPGQLGSHVHFLPQMGATSTAQSARLPRTVSYTEFNAIRNLEHTVPNEKIISTDSDKNYSTSFYHPSLVSSKENRPPSQSRLPTPFPCANRVPTPNPFSGKMASWDFDMPAQGPSSLSSGPSRMQRGAAPPPEGRKCSPKLSTIEAPKSRKEGLKVISPRALQKERYENKTPRQNLSATVATKNLMKDNDRVPQNTSTLSTPAVRSHIEDIDIDSIDSASNSMAKSISENIKPLPYIPSHKPGTSSLDSTGRLERQLYSALGEELGSLGEGANNAQFGQDLTRSFAEVSMNSELIEFELAGKRKRQGTFGAERAKSPVTKKEKGEMVEGWVEGGVGVGLEVGEKDAVGQVPQLRGG